MEIIRIIATIGALLGAAWLATLLFFACKQFNQRRLNWVYGANLPPPTNAAVDYIVRTLGLEDFDRLSCIMLISAAIMAWPVGLVVGYPVIATCRARQQFRLKADQFARPE